MTRAWTAFGWLALVVLLAWTTSASADPLGLQLGFPQTSTVGSGSASYDATSGALTVTVTPKETVFPPVPPGTTETVVTPKSWTITVNVTNAGAPNLDAATTTDLVITGHLESTNDGVLLTGSLARFGYTDTSTNHRWDFTFHVTGGTLAPYFAGQDIGVLVHLFDSFGNGFTQSFSGAAKDGTVGPASNCSVGDFVWNDVNHNGIQDPGEPGIDGVTVRLRNTITGAVVGTTTSDVGPLGQHGYYQFYGICQTDHLQVEVDTPSGFTPTTVNASGSTTANDSNPNPSTFSMITTTGNNYSYSNNQTLDFGFYSTCNGAIGDFVWHDSNRNGLQDSGELGINGITLRLHSGGLSGPVVGTTTTTNGPGGAPGYYQFTSLCVGSYTVEVDTTTLPPGFTPTTSGVGTNVGLDSNGSPAPVALVATGTGTSADQTIDFGYISPCTGVLGDFVWHDDNRNGLQDTGEQGLDGVHVLLLNGSQTVIADTYTTTLAGQHGVYRFTGLCGGTYTVTVDTTSAPLAGLSPTSTNTSPATVTLPDDNTMNVALDFGYVSPCLGRIGDRVWVDVNGNGIQDSGEPGLGGVSLRLRLAADNSLVQTTTSLSDGSYAFVGLCGSDYLVEVLTPAGYNPTTATAPGSTTANDSNPNPAPVTLTDGFTGTSSDLTIDFGFVTGSLGDRVWHDFNGDGVQNTGEPGVSGVTVTLRDAGGSVLGTTTTGSNGGYTFSTLAAGTYGVCVTPPAGFTQTYDLDGLSTANCASVTLAAGQNRTDVDFGYRQLGSLGDRVWNDLNADGVQDTGEGGLNGLTVTLRLNSVVISTTTTAGDGTYAFTGLPTATYSVCVTPPTGYGATYDLDGISTPDCATVTLAPGQNRTDVDFGYRQLGPSITSVDPTSGSIGTFVTITGINFEPNSTTVSFNGLAPVVRSITTTQITTTVPIAATTGPLTVTTSRGTASVSFTVPLTGDFAVSAVPANPRAIAGDQAAVAITAPGGGAFTNLVSLSISSGPTGITPVFDSAQIAPGGMTTLTFQVANTVAAATYAYTITGQAAVDGRTVSHTASVTLTVLDPATVALTGRIMTAEALPRPIPGVTVTLGTALATTDAGGNFLVLSPPTGPNMLFVDGRTASTVDAQYPIVEVQVTVASSGPTRVPFTIFLPILDTVNAVTLPLDANGFTTQVVKATTPAIPGLVVTVPAGTRIIGPDGNPVSQLVITRVPVDRSPMPFPAGKVPRLLLAINPGGSVPSQPLPVTFPNSAGSDPGTSAELYYFDLTQGTWSIWGHGTVTGDGSQIASNPGVGLPRLAWHWASISADAAPDSTKNRHAHAGDPVDLVTGRFTVTKTDLVIPGRIPIVIQRSYRSEDQRAALFGAGWTLAPYDSQITGNGGPSLTLVQPDRSSYLLTRPDPNVAAWRNNDEPFLAGAVVTPLTGDFNFQIRYKDGTIHRYQKVNGTLTAALVAIQDRNGNVLTITRSTDVNVRTISSITEPGGRVVTVTNDPVNNRITQITDPIGRTVQYTYDGSARLTTVTDPAGGVTTYAYDSTGRILSITDPRGITYLTNEYRSSDGRVVRQTQADAGVWQFGYTVPSAPAGCPAVGCPGAPPSASTDVIDPRNNHTHYEFTDAASQLGNRMLATGGFTSSITDALGQDRHLDPLGVTLSDALGRPTTPEYDANLNLVRLTDAAGAVWSYTYEPTFNRLTSATDPLNHVTGLEYDVRGNLTGVVDPLGKRTTIAYDGLGQPTSITDPLNQATTLGYDTYGNLTSLTDPLGNTTTRTYDLVGRMIRQGDPLGKVATFSYDVLNRLVAIVDPQGGRTAFTYDRNGNLLTVIDAGGNTTTYTYDDMDRLTTRMDPLGATETFAYDPLGNLTSHTDRKHQVTTYTYDALNRRTQAAYADSSTTFTYDAVGRLNLVNDTAGGVLSYSYDVLDRLATESSPLGAVSYAYDLAGRRTTLQAPGVAPVSYGYDAVSRLTSISQAPLAAAAIQYDDAGRRTRLTLPNQVSTDYQYDAASRLTALLYRNAGGSLGDLAYQYDAAGNRVSIGGSFGRTLLPDAIATTIYDAGNRQLTFGAATMVYDTNGNLTTLTDDSGVSHLGWDARDRLVSLTGPSATASFIYDGLGRRGNRQIGTEHTSYVYDGVDVTQEVTASSVQSYLRTLAIDEALRRGGTEFYLSDALGSTAALTDHDGALTTRYSYTPFGATSVDGASSNPLQYTGREGDATGLYYYRARYYHPTLQHFISEDPLLCDGSPVPIRSIKNAPQHLNAYAYSGNAPTMFRDPLGLSPECAYYDQRCGEVTNRIAKAYHCTTAKTVCENAPRGPYTSCIRECLQSVDREVCVPRFGRKDSTGLGAALCDLPLHAVCFQSCLPTTTAVPKRY